MKTDCLSFKKNKSLQLYVIPTSLQLLSQTSKQIA